MAPSEKRRINMNAAPVPEDDEEYLPTTRSCDDIFGSPWISSMPNQFGSPWISSMPYQFGSPLLSSMPSENGSALITHSISGKAWMISSVTPPSMHWYDSVFSHCMLDPPNSVNGTPNAAEKSSNGRSGGIMLDLNKPYLENGYDDDEPNKTSRSESVENAAEILQMMSIDRPTMGDHNKSTLHQLAETVVSNEESLDSDASEYFEQSLPPPLKTEERGEQSPTRIKIVLGKRRRETDFQREFLPKISRLDREDMDEDPDTLDAMVGSGQEGERCTGNGRRRSQRIEEK